MDKLVVRGTEINVQWNLICTILKRIFATFSAFSLQDEPILLSYFNFRFVQFTKVAI